MRERARTHAKTPTPANSRSLTPIHHTPYPIHHTPYTIHHTPYTHRQAKPHSCMSARTHACAHVVCLRAFYVRIICTMCTCVHSLTNSFVLAKLLLSIDRNEDGRKKALGASEHACMNVCLHACIHVCLHVCMHVCMYGSMRTLARTLAR
jgi:hypothetical protein